MKELAAKGDDPGLTSRTQEEKTNSHKLSSDFHIYTHNEQINTFKRGFTLTDIKQIQIRTTTWYLPLSSNAPKDCAGMGSMERVEGRHKSALLVKSGRVRWYLKNTSRAYGSARIARDLPPP